MLTPKQAEILKAFQRNPDATFNEIAAQFDLQYNTVKSHMDNIRERLGVKTRAGAVKTAEKLGII